MNGSDKPSSDLRDVRLSRGPRPILRGVTFEVPRGELVAIMGPSGSGKTTVLRAIAGARAVFEAGRIAVGDVVLDGRGAATGDRSARCVGKWAMVFQFHCLFEHLSAIENVCLAPVHAPRRRRRLTPNAAPGSCSRRSASSTAPTPCRATCRAAKPSGWQSRGRWPSIRRCS